MIYRALYGVGYLDRFHYHSSSTPHLKGEKGRRWQCYYKTPKDDGHKVYLSNYIQLYIEIRDRILPHHCTSMYKNN